MRMFFYYPYYNKTRNQSDFPFYRQSAAIEPSAVAGAHQRCKTRGIENGKLAHTLFNTSRFVVRSTAPDIAEA